MIFFGERTYGIAAAAETFYGKRLEDLTVGGRPQRWRGFRELPSRYNPGRIPRSRRRAAATCCGG